MPDADADKENRRTEAGTAATASVSSPPPELDDWGLPVRKRAVVVPVEPQSAPGEEDEDNSEAFEDAEEQIHTPKTQDPRSISSSSSSPSIAAAAAFSAPRNHASSSNSNSNSRPISRSGPLPAPDHLLDARAAALRRKRELELQQIKAGTVPKETSRIDARLAASQVRPALDGRPATPQQHRRGVSSASASPGLEQGVFGEGAVAPRRRVQREVSSASLVGGHDGTTSVDVSGERSAGEVRTSDLHASSPVVDSGPKQVDVDAANSAAPAASTPALDVHSAAEHEGTSTESHPSHKRNISAASFARSHADSVGSTATAPGASEWSHQQLAPMKEVAADEEAAEEDEWQAMPAYAPFNIYNDDGKLIAVEHEEEEAEVDNYHMQLGGAGKGYTRVQMDEDAQSATSMDENTAYLFKEPTNNVLDDDEEGRDMLSQMQTTKNILTETQRIAYVGIVRLGMIEVNKELDSLERTRGTKKLVESARESGALWSQKMMVRLYSHMEIESAEQVMIEQLAEHGVQPSDLTPSLMINARIKNPMRDEAVGDANVAEAGKSSSSLGHLDASKPDRPLSTTETLAVEQDDGRKSTADDDTATLAGPSDDIMEKSKRSDDNSVTESESDAEDIVPKITDVTEIEHQQNLELDIRWTILCDLFLILISDSIYDSRSRRLLEFVGSYLDVSTLDVCRFEKRITDALEMQEAANKENWNEDDHMEERRKQNKKRRMVMMGLATVGGGLVIGLSAGLLAPLIGAGLAAGFTTFGVAGTGTFLAGAGGAAIITTTGVVTGSNIGFKASERRTGSVRTFEYRPLHNNKRVNLIVTVAGWLTGKVDDVRLPFSTVDPIMGDIYSVFWEPEMLQSMGDTINILATEALTQALQQVLGSTILVALMAAIQLPIVLTKLAYLIDNPWTVSLARADLAGLILADSLMARNLGARPITLVGFSLGSRVIYACLRELAKKGQFGIIQNVYMFGSPIVIKKDEYTKILSIVPGRFVNGFATNDWILGYLFRATGGGVMKVAGLTKVDHPRIENYNVTEFVPGHMSYRKMMPRLMREVGWQVESDEFTEIEDPDPDNHEKRQRELIDEIEEARRALDKDKKSKFSWFRKKKIEASEKKDWEMYDEKVRDGSVEDRDALEAKAASGVLFDINALQKEIAVLAAEGIQVKELPSSTLPPMKIDLSSSSSNAVFTPERKLSVEDRSSSVPPANNNVARPALASGKTEASLPQAAKQSGFFGFGSKSSASSSIPVAAATAGVAIGAGTAIAAPALERSVTASQVSSPPPAEESITLSFESPTPASSSMVSIDLNHNAWADDDEYGAEREMTMTFE